MDNTYLILAITILIILVITVLFRNEELLLNKNEGFSNYMDVRTKTLNWCNKLKNSGIMNEQQFEECLNKFNENSAGIVPKEFATPETGMARDYSLYNTENKSLSSNISGGETNNIILASNSGLYMLCSPDNKISFIKNIDDSTINQDGLNFTLAPQSGDIYGILSPYGKYLTATDNLTANFISNTVANSSSWIATRMDNKIIFESVFYKGFYLSFKEEDNSLAVVYGKNDNMNWTIINKVSSGNGNFVNIYSGEEYIVKKENIMTNFEKLMNNKEILETMVQKLIELKGQISSNMDNARNNFNDLVNAKISASNTMGDGGIANQNIFTNDNVGSVIDSITSLEGTYLQQIDEEISKLNTKLNGINLNNIQTEFDLLVNELENDTKETDNRIRENNLIMMRQQQEYQNVNTKLGNISSKMDKIEINDTTSKLNIDIVNKQSSSNSSLIIIYKVLIFILGLIVIYLAYSTIIKFKKNIYDKYL